ncbi:helix-turn-helix domain-containing protein [Cephaloticoccus capnophilus]|uniref:helix-turn-helix domain-containing protein n=1 Tax=Cephaloticoccus capnophilus TaxID=1548208 RepID=UPI0018D47D8B|nr:helix-turn-helix domain-containing protein [Cephaloticoccus capnophilus]
MQSLTPVTRRAYNKPFSRTEIHPEQIKALLRMKGITPTALADELGVGHSSVSQVISGKSVSARIRASIAEIIGMSVEELWPHPRPALRRTREQVQAMRQRVPA